MAKRRLIKKYYKKRNPVRPKTIIIVAVCIFCGLSVAALAILFVPRLIGTTSTYYLAGTSPSVELYYYDTYDEHLLRSTDTLVRGSEVTFSGENYTENGRTYSLVDYEGTEYYVEEGAIVSDSSEVIQETEKWVRTSVTVYENHEDSRIASFIKKGNRLEILGYNEINADGSVDMYEIECGGVTGWVYSKYLAETQAEAEAQHESVYQSHAGREYSMELYGGDTEDLDWYPYEKVSFEGNELLSEDARCMYINEDAIKSIDEYLKLAEDSGVNAVVVDIKDGLLVTAFDTAEELSPSSNETTAVSQTVFQDAINKIKEAGLYLIARIVVFNDSFYAKDNPEDCIVSSADTITWVSAYSRDAWYYNVSLAEEVIEKYGVNEIQFDYVRFPDTTYRMSLDENTDFKNTYDESKAEAIQNFLFYACDQIHRYNVYVSVDVFGECAGKYVTSYGQYWPAISNVADVISGMPYTDHFGSSVDTWTEPYNTLLSWGKSVVDRQSEIETPAVVRTWLTGYNVPVWSPTIECNAEYVISQAQALYDAGITGGFMVWNGSSSFERYSIIAPAWQHSY